MRSLARRLFHALAVVAVGLTSYGCCCFFRIPDPPTQPAQSVTPVAPAAAAAAAPREVEKRAVAGKEGATIGRITADVAWFAVAKPKYKARIGGGDFELKEDHLVVAFRFSTSDKTLSAHYVGFNQFLSQVTAQDEFGNRLPFSNGSSTYEAVGDSEGRTIRAGEPVVRVLTFEKPLAASRRVDIDVSASCVGEKGTFRFTVPLDAIPERK